MLNTVIYSINGHPLLKFLGKYTKHKLQQIGDVEAQLAKATGRHQTEDAAVPGSNPAPPVT
jgi:hypothetical protein